MKNFLNFASKVSIPTLLLLLPVLVFAAGPQPASQGNNTAPPSAGILSVQGVLNFMCTLFDWAFYFLIALAVVFGIVAAFKYLTSSGEAEKVKSAGSTLLYAAIAVAVALLARGVPLIVGSFLGASGNIGACGASSSGGGSNGLVNV
jgi:hypothetical protein